MSGRDRDIAQAKERALIARARLAATMSDIQDRLHPRALLNEAWQEVRERSQDLADGAVDAVRARPLTTSAIVAAAIALLVRKPIGQALKTLFARRDETPSVEAELTSQASPPSSIEAETAPTQKEIA